MILHATDQPHILTVHRTSDGPAIGHIVIGGIECGAFLYGPSGVPDGDTREIGRHVSLAETVRMFTTAH
jgi:hypothetical protein